MRRSLVAHLAGWLVFFALILGAELGLAHRPPLGEALRYAGTEIAIGFALTSGLWWLYRRLRLPRTTPGLFAGALLATFLGAAVWLALAAVIEPLVGVDDPASLVVLEIVTGESFDHVIILLVWHGGALALRGLQRAAAAERMAQEARLAALRYQLNPHFLFNTLNSTIAMTYEDVARARTMLTLLGDLLRHTLKSDAAVSTVGQELQVIERYIEIERLCYEDKLRVAIDVTEAARVCRIPPLLLHGLVENAVKHGMHSSPMPLEITLRADFDGQALRVEVENTGSLGGGPEGTGLTNLRARLEALYAGRYRFSLVAREDRVRAALEIDGPEVAS